MGTSSISVLSVLLLVSVLWKPTYGSDKCSLACSGSSTTPAFLNGHKYNYGVEGTVTIYLTGASNQETSVKLLGQVSVTALGNCIHELKVQNLAIGGPDGKKYHSPKGIDKPVRFTLQDGRIGTEICTEDEDTRRSLNIKRAIISLLQTEQKSSTQVDVFGSCPTEVSSSQEGGSVLVHRSRDLSRCGYREQGRNELITGVFNSNAEIKDTQVLGSRLNVETKVNKGVPEKVSATEEYLYRPFSVGENGARAKVHTKLTLTNQERAANTPSHCTESRTIIFEKPHGTSSHNGFQSGWTAVKETAKNIQTEANSKSAGNFAQLIRILRTNSKDELLKIYSHVKGDKIQKRVFLDGLLRAGTGYSIEVSIQLLKNKELDFIEQRLVFLSLGNARHANNEAVKAAASLLDLPQLPKEAYLGVGALAGSFCREHQCHKVKNDGVTALSQKFAAKLQSCRPKTKVEEDNIVAILKGVRNIRHLEDNLVEKLARCALDNNVKPRIKAAVFEAFQADACTPKLKKTAIDVLKNRQLDSEIRIKAYLAVISCPCAGSATEIKKLLDSEPVHQVGNFISTSLRNIRTSSNPDKQLARQHYGLIRTPNKFNNDIRKYSFTEEESFNIDALGVGGTIEQNVIYSQDSFLPRSVAVNLTTEVFGHSLNVLEVGARQGNLDRVAEHIFGPKGFLRTQDFQEIYKKYIAGPFFDYKEKASRGRRSVKSEVDAFDKNLRAESAPYNNELDLDVYVKLFGTDAVFLSLGDGKGFDFDKITKEFLELVNKGIDEVKNFKQEVRANLLFLDAELVYPTSTGLPLKLDLIGAATGRFEAATKIDIRQVLKSPQDAKIDIKLVPSTDIEVSGAFSVDADAVAAGLKVIINFHTSTGAHVIAKVLEGGRGFDLEFGLPINKQEIITASNDLVYFQTEKGQADKYTVVKTENPLKETHLCFDQAAEFLGLTICGDLALPFTFSGPEGQASISKFVANYPLSGSAKVRLSLEKQSLRGYHVKGVVRSDQSGKRAFELLFDAEGAKHGRAELTGEYIYSDSAIGAQISLKSDLKTIFGQVSATRSPSELTLLVKGKYDENELYGKAGFRVRGGSGRTVYTPIAEYKLPGDKEIHNIPISGEVIEEVNGSTRKYTIRDVKLDIPNKKDPVCIDGHFVSAGSKETEFDVNVKDVASLKGSLKNNDVFAEFKNTLNPYINFRLKGHSECDQTIRNEFDLVYGPELNAKDSRIVFEQLYKYHKGEKDFNLVTKNKFEIYAIPVKAHFDADVDPKKIIVSAEGQFQGKKASFNLAGRTQIKKPGDYSFNVKAEADKNGFEVFAKRDIESDEKSNFENYVEVKNVGRYELSGVVTQKIKPNDYNVGAVGHLKISSGGKSQDIAFNVGQSENANAFNSHANVKISNDELLDFLVKGTRGDGQLKLVVKNTISANGHYKVTDNNGNGVIIVDFKQSQRKLKGDFKYSAKAPNYGAEVDVYFNFEKDNNDKLSFSTATKRTEKLVDSKNKLAYNNKKFEFNVRQDGVFDKSGKTDSLVELVLPEGRFFTLKLNRDMTENKGTYNGHADVVFSFAEGRGGADTVLSYKAKIANTNYEKQIFNYDGQLELKLKDGKNLLDTFTFKNSPEGDKSKFEGKIDISGSLVPKPIAISGYIITADSISIRDDKYRLKVGYGDDIGFEFDEVYKVTLLEQGEKKLFDDASLAVRLPFEKAHDIKWAGTVLYVLPDNSDEAEYTIVEHLQINADVYKIDANAKAGTETGHGTVKLLVPHVDPVVLDVNYKNNRNNDQIDNRVELKATYGKGKSASIVTEASVAPRDNRLSFKANAPNAEKFKKLEFAVHSKNPTPDTYISDVKIDADGRVYKSESNIAFSKSNPVIDIKFSSPENPKPSRFFVKGNALSSTQGKVELKVENINQLSLEIYTEANVQKENIAFKTVANSDKLGWKNYIVQIASKDADNGKRLEFQASNNNKNVFSGSTSFVTKQEGSKSIIEGSGSVKIQEEQKSANFKYIRTILSEGNERGIETFFDMAIGDRTYVAETRVTNLEYKNSYLYCEQKKECAHAEFVSKIDLSKSGTVVNTVNAIFDLRKLGIAPEFGLNIKDEVSDKKLPQYTLDLHVNKDVKKYHLHIYNTPEVGNAKSGITVNLPHRVLALESLVTYPTDKGLPFPIRGDVSLDMDKNKSGHKTSARFLVDVDVTNDKHPSAVAEFGFNHPKLNKEATVKFRGNVHLPAPNSIKIESSTSISHPVLGADREAKVLFEGSPTHLKFLIISPLVKVIDVEGTVIVKDNLQKGELKFCLLEGKPVQVTAIAKDYQYFEFTTGYSDEAGRKLSIVGNIQPEKRVDFSADLVLGGEKKNIIHGALFIADDIIKSDYGTNVKNFEYFLDALKKDLANLDARVKNLFNKANNEFKALLKRIEPTLKELEKTYTDDFDKFYREIVDDKTLQEISQSLHDITTYIAKIIDEVIQGTKPLVEQITKFYVETAKKVTAMYEKQIEPQLKQLEATISAVLKEYYEALLSVISYFAGLVQDLYEKNKPQFEELTTVVTNIFKDLTRLLVVQLREFRARWNEVCQEISLQIKEMPFLATLKEKYQELAVPEQGLAILQDVYGTLSGLLPTAELRDFFDTVYRYNVKKLRHEKVDDEKELKEIYRKLSPAISSLIQFIRNEFGQYGISTSYGSFKLVSIIPENFFSSPTFGGTASASLISQLLQGDVPDALAAIKAYRPRSLNPFDEVPAKLRAVVVNGQHIFTFDGRHLTFPGNCRYVLAHDHVDRNFTLLLQLVNGAPKALILEDKSGAVLELKDNGGCTLNGANRKYPIIEKDSFAFRQANGRIGLGSLYGIMVFCTTKLEVCYIEVNGFYLGKLRGLLGDGNNEPFDDFRLPTGKISDSESEFGNSYRLARSCPQVQTPEHSHHQLHHAALPPACEKVFGGTSTLRPLSLFLDIAPFRQACIHACTGDTAEALHVACDLARGYTALAVTGLLPAVLPDVCVKCTDADKPRNVGESYELKVPNKQADIIVVFETTTVNEKNYKSIVVPLVTQVVNGLKSKHINDIKVYLVGLTNKYPYPIVYDTDLTLKSPKVQFDDKSRYSFLKDKIDPSDDPVLKFAAFAASLYDTLSIELALNNVDTAYYSVFDLPLRAGAVKHAINVGGEECISPFFLLEELWTVASNVLFENIAYTHSVIAVTPLLEVGGGKDYHQIVGYTDKAVIMLGDKKVGKDAENLRASLEKTPDACRDYYEATDGIVFSATNFHNLDGGKQKQYLQTASAAILQRMLHQSVVEDCTCTYVDAFSARSFCVAKDRKEVARRRK